MIHLFIDALVCKKEKLYYIFYTKRREHQQKTFAMLSRFQQLRGWGGGEFSESVKKGKFMTEIFFQIMLNEVLKIYEK